MLMMKSYQKTCGAFLQWPCLGEPEVDDDVGDDGDDDNDDVGDDGDDGDDDDDGGDNDDGDVDGDGDDGVVVQVNLQLEWVAYGEHLQGRVVSKYVIEGIQIFIDNSPKYGDLGVINLCQKGKTGSKLVQNQLPQNIWVFLRREFYSWKK